MADPYIGEIRILAFGYPPRGWAFCLGQLLPINQYQALFSLLGTMYGGNGTTNFALPNLQGRAPMHLAADYPQGAVGGETVHTLTASEMPAHSHGVVARPAASPGSLTADPIGAMWAQTSKAAFGPSPTVTMASPALASAGNSQPHDNMPPYLVLNFAIALVGIFPSRP